MKCRASFKYHRICVKKKLQSLLIYGLKTSLAQQSTRKKCVCLLPHPTFKMESCLALVILSLRPGSPPKADWNLCF